MRVEGIPQPAGLPGSLHLKLKKPILGLARMGFGGDASHFFRSKRSRFITLVQALTKSLTNFPSASLLA